LVPPDSIWRRPGASANVSNGSGSSSMDEMGYPADHSPSRQFITHCQTANKSQHHDQPATEGRAKIIRRDVQILQRPDRSISSASAYKEDTAGMPTPLLYAIFLISPHNNVYFVCVYGCMLPVTL